eukprot:TRINITY_DN6463_c0_g2_i3.p1 TRINITY_DN6463_c0_g2~~TRINITY_DN6463_c0_g2_i3.p1  ORF type:complete len:500 (+),score=73.22 TRINITY_DN6463_c0_g2_i3:77-1501(+)
MDQNESNKPLMTDTTAKGQDEVVEDIDDPSRKENFIPFRLEDLKSRLISTYPESFTKKDAESQFKTLINRLSTFTKLRLGESMEEIVNEYTWVDPDSDVTLPVELTEDELEHRAESFIDTKIPSVLEDAGFLEVPQEEMDESKNNKNANGIEVIPPPEHMIYYKMYQRGRVKVERTYRSWRTLWRKKSYIGTEYKRLFVIFSLRDDESDRQRKEFQNDNLKVVLSTEEVKQDESAVEVVEYKWWMFWNWCKGPKYIKIKGVKPDMVYMKIFKDMHVGDIDQLVPGTKVKFSLLDKLMIWVPVIFGFCAAIYKAARGHLTFKLWIPLLTTIFLVVFPLYYGYRAYAAIKQKGADLRARLNELFLLHNLTNNSGVLSYLVEEAQEQEDKEILLAYFFLWHAKRAMSKEEIDETVEVFLGEVMAKFGIVMKFDFDVADAISDCVNLGLAFETSTNMYMAVDLATAAQRVSVKNFKQK